MVVLEPFKLTPWQCRMARAGLRWSILDLAERSRVGKTTIVRFENEQSGSNPSTRAALRRVFESAGVSFDDCLGVYMPETMKELEGED
jgi:transcriptional regulator with XRE-family HTH domain